MSGRDRRNERATPYIKGVLHCDGYLQILVVGSELGGIVALGGLSYI
jgi:hypothetical protein